MSRKTQKIISLVCTAFLVTMFLCPTAVFAAGYGDYLSDRDVEKVLTYTTFAEDGSLIFDTEQAIRDNMSEDIIAAGKSLEEFAYAYQLEAINQERGIEVYISIPIYGNYCGPGTEPNAGNPVDYLDSCCKTHDDCYGSVGYFACTCDEQLIDDINLKYAQMTGSTKQAALAIKTYFTMALGNPTKYGGVLVPVPPEYVTSAPSCATDPK